MKTQVIQLSQKEDTISIRDKMSWCQTGRILLVWPEHGQILNRQLDLTLLKRYAKELGAEIAIVTKDPDVRAVARQLSIPVFHDPLVAEQRDWNSKTPGSGAQREDFVRPDLTQMSNAHKSNKSTWSNHLSVKIVCLGASILAIVALAIFILPGATVVLTPQTTTQSLTIDLIADPKASTVNYSTGSLPAYNKEIIIEGSASISTTGSIAVPDEAARGSLVFTNESHQLVTLPPGTLVTTLGDDPIRFATTNPVEVPLMPGKPLEVEAAAVKPGSTGNVLSGSLVAIESDLGLVVSVTNPEAMSGGVDVYLNSPSEQDLRVVRNRLGKSLEQQALVRLQSDLPGEDILLLPSVEIMETIEERTSPGVNEPGEQVELYQRLRIQGLVVAGETLENFVTPMLDATLPTGYSPVQNNIKITPTSDQTLESDGKVHWTVRVERSLMKPIPNRQLADSIRGATKSEAIDRLSIVAPGIEQAEIALMPAWWPRLPLLAMRIRLIAGGSQ